MAARSSMAALISRVRLLINDTKPVPDQIFTDDMIQDVMDEGREDVANRALKPVPTYSSGTIQYVNYYSAYGGWESDYILKQYRTNVVTPSSVEPIAGHFAFAVSTFPPVHITGKLHDIYRAAADLLEMRAVMLSEDFDVVVGGQTFKQSQAPDALEKRVKSFRMKQRPRAISMTRSDIKNTGEDGELSLRATSFDYMSSGNGGG